MAPGGVEQVGLMHQEAPGAVGSKVQEALGQQVMVGGGGGAGLLPIHGGRRQGEHATGQGGELSLPSPTVLLPPLIGRHRIWGDVSMKDIHILMSPRSDVHTLPYIIKDYIIKVSCLPYIIKDYITKVSCLPSIIKVYILKVSCLSYIIKFSCTVAIS